MEFEPNFISIAPAYDTATGEAMVNLFINNKPISTLSPDDARNLGLAIIRTAEMAESKAVLDLMFAMMDRDEKTRSLLQAAFAAASSSYYGMDGDGPTEERQPEGEEQPGQLVGSEGGEASA